MLQLNERFLCNMTQQKNQQFSKTANISINWLNEFFQSEFFNFVDGIKRIAADYCWHVILILSGIICMKEVFIFISLMYLFGADNLLRCHISHIFTIHRGKMGRLIHISYKIHFFRNIKFNVNFLSFWFHCEGNL